MSDALAGRTALVTGCTRGIGRETAEALIGAGCRVAGVARSADGVPAGVYFRSCDLRDAEQSQSSLAALAAELGSLDYVVGNAGAGTFKPVEELDLGEWEAMIKLNLTANFVLLRTVLPSMKARDFGRIVLISSDACRLPFADAAGYCASKAGLDMMVRCVRKEVAGFDIKLTTITPGRVDTHFNSKQPGDRPDSLRTPDIAAQVLHALQQSDRCEIEEIVLNSVREKELH